MQHNSDQLVTLLMCPCAACSAGIAKLSKGEKARCVKDAQSINRGYICCNEIHRDVMPAIHQKTRVWLLMLS
jgi:hypothetical protein